MDEMDFTDKGDRYIVFAYSTYYPCGGMYDCVLMTDDLVEAKKVAEEELSRRFGPDNAEIFDTVSKEVINVKGAR